MRGNHLYCCGLWMGRGALNPCRLNYIGLFIPVYCCRGFGGAGGWVFQHCRNGARQTQLGGKGVKHFFGIVAYYKYFEYCAWRL